VIGIGGRSLHRPFGFSPHPERFGPFPFAPGSFTPPCQRQGRLFPDFLPLFTHGIRILRTAPFARPGSAYFVTWRLDGSLPVTRVTDFWTSDGPKFVELDQLLDAVSTGPRWLERRDVAGVVANALWKGVRESRYELGAWVLMPNHVHIALRPWAIRISLLRSGALRAAAHTQQIGY
jgi:hypothetical protein